jgi:hypothetical protein
MRDTKNKVYHITIEGSDYEQMQNLFEEIQNKYNLYDNCVLTTGLAPTETIIDYWIRRHKETGGLKILPKRVVLDYVKKSEQTGYAFVKFKTNLKGLNEITKDGRTFLLTDAQAENLLEQMKKQMEG